jgi:hypothetical protein
MFVISRKIFFLKDSLKVILFLGQKTLSLNKGAKEECSKKMKMASNHRMTKRKEKYLRSTDKSWWITSLGMIRELEAQRQ